MEVEPDQFVNFEGYGKVPLAPLLTSLTHRPTSLWDLLATHLPQGGGYTPDNKKFVLTFWMTMLSLQHSLEDDVIRSLQALLSETLQHVICDPQWEMADGNVFRIVRFLASCWVKLWNVSGDHGDQDSLVSLLYVLYQTGAEKSEVSAFYLQLTTMLEGQIAVPSSPVPSSPVPCCKGAVVTLLTSSNIPLILDILSAPQYLGTIRNYQTYLNNQTSRRMSLLHRVIFRLSGQCTSIRALSQLQQLEATLVRALFSYNYLVLAVAGDLLVFITRLAPSSYVASVINLLCDMIPRITCPIRSHNILTVLQRILLFKDSRINVNKKIIDVERGLLELLPDKKMAGKLSEAQLKDWDNCKARSDSLVKVLPCCPNIIPLLVLLTDKLTHTHHTDRQTDTQTHRLNNLYMLVGVCLSSVRDNLGLYWSTTEAVDKLFGCLVSISNLGDAHLSCLILDILELFSSYKGGGAALLAKLPSNVPSNMPSNVPSNLEGAAYTALVSKLLQTTQTDRNRYVAAKCGRVTSLYVKGSSSSECVELLEDKPDTDKRDRGVTSRDISILLDQPPSKRWILNKAVKDILSLGPVPPYITNILHQHS